MSSTPSPAPAIGDPARPYIGGQAVLEGVMMRSPQSVAIVVRRRDSSLHVRERAIADGRKGVWKMPLARGVASLVESLKLGSESLKFSAEQMEKDLEAEELEAARSASKSAAKAVSSVLRAIGLTLFLMTTSDADEPDANAETPKAKKESAPPAAIPASDEKKKNGAMGLMFVVMLAVMWALPQAAAAGTTRLFHLDLEMQSPGFQALTGAFKLSIVIGYLLLVRRQRDIRRVFQYHGAEHKTISTYEAGEALTVANARAKTTLHPRCGTTFLVMVALVSVIVFSALGGLLPRIETGNAVLNNLVFFIAKIPFIPVIAAFTFELQRVFARYFTKGPLRAVLWPGFLVQKITTIEPDDDQLEVALASLKVTLFREGGEASKNAGDVRFANYDAVLAADRLRAAA